MGIIFNEQTAKEFRQTLEDSRLLREFAERARGNTHPTAASSWSFYPTGTRPRTTKAELRSRFVRHPHAG